MQAQTNKRKTYFNDLIDKLKIIIHCLNVHMKIEEL